MTAQARRTLRAFADLGATDTTCFLGQWPYRLSAAADADALRAHAERLGLRSVWVSTPGVPVRLRHAHRQRGRARRVSDDPLFRVFATIDPRDPTWREELDDAWPAAPAVCASPQASTGMRSPPCARSSTRAPTAGSPCS